MGGIRLDLGERSGKSRYKYGSPKTCTRLLENGCLCVTESIAPSFHVRCTVAPFLFPYKRLPLMPILHPQLFVFSGNPHNWSVEC